MMPIRVRPIVKSTDATLSRPLTVFYLLISTQVLSLIGSTMTGIALGIWVFTETGDTTPLLLESFFYLTPQILLGSFSGVLADRMSRRFLIIVGDAGQAIPTLFLLIVFVTGNFALWHLYVAAFVQSMFALLQGPAIGASITMLVPDKHRDRANAIHQVTQPFANLVGPLLAGFLYAWVDVTGIILLDLLTFVVAVTVISFVHIPTPPASADSNAAGGTLWSELKGGIIFLLKRKGLLMLTLYFTFVNFITNGVFRIMMPYYLILTNDEHLVGILLGLGSLGLVTGGIATIFWRGTGSRVDTIMIGQMLAGLGLMFFGIVRTPLALGIVSFLMMLPYKMTNALLASINQVKIPPDMQGRVISLQINLASLATPLVLIITGPLIDNILEPAVGGESWVLLSPLFGSEPGAGMGLYIMVCGSLLLLSSAIVYAIPAVRYLERDTPDYYNNGSINMKNARASRN